MDNFPDLKELLSYGDEYKLNEPIMSDYFIPDPTRQQDNQPSQNNQSNTDEDQEEINCDNQTSEQESPVNQEDNDDEFSSQSEQEEKQGMDSSTPHDNHEEYQEEASNPSEQSTRETEEISSSQEPKKSDEEEITNDNEQSNTGEEVYDDYEEEAEEQDTRASKDSGEETELDESSSPQEISESDEKSETTEETKEKDVSSEETDSINSDDQDSENEKTQEEIKKDEEQSGDAGFNDTKQSDDENSEKVSDEKTINDNEEELDEDENDFDDLMNNYDDDKDPQTHNNKSKGEDHASSKINEITGSKIYRTLKRLVSLSYDAYQKGAYKYDKKEVVKHYITNQKFKIINDLVSPTFKPDIYVFDLSPSNDNFLEMYVNAIGSVAMKNSLIYLTFNERILRKLEIKKSNSRGMDVKRVVNSDMTRYANFDCTVYDEYTTIYEELKDVKNRKIYIFSDFDVRDDMVLLSKENPDIVWFSTQDDDPFMKYYSRNYPTQYKGYYVATSGIDDIEKYILEKNKNRYRRK